MKFKPLWQEVTSGLVKGAVVAVLLPLFLPRRANRSPGQRSWKERAVSDLLAPLYMQFDRTSRAYQRYKESRTFLEAKVIRDGNLAIRDLLLAKPHLIPPSLLDDAARLIEHYDRWFEEFERLRLAEKPDLESHFVFLGPQGLRFPSDAEVRFKETFRKYWSELYGEAG
jgi:hypothetical protein